MATKNTDYKIFDLNMKCLMEVFNKLNYTDMLSMRRVHSAFKEGIELACSNKEFTFDINTADDDCLTNLETIQNFLILFGTKIKDAHLKIFFELRARNYTTVKKQIVAFIANYCTNVNFTRCTFTNFELNTTFLNENEEFFRRLQTLHASAIWMDNVLIQYLPKTNLKEFKYAAYNQGQMNPPLHLVLLECIAASKLERCEITILQLHGCSKFRVPENNTLKYLHFNGDIIIHKKSLEQFRNLESLAINLFHYELGVPEMNWNKLKHLELAGYNIDFIGELGEMNCLESLTLKNNRYSPYPLNDPSADDKLAAILCQMTNLKRLIIKVDIDIELHLPAIGCNLLKLESFENRGLHAASQNASKILEFVLLAKNLTYLNVTVHDYQKFYSDLVDIRRMAQNDAVLCVEFPFGCHVHTTPEEEKFVRGN